ncbi:MAG: class I SAM-dependent DNA methyltransferase, partial [Thermoanaerobaculia bacterium]|nr:class I SAM-dependent DNA methyltransferase [Thermoanaerobaculia bacterium]
MPNSPTADPAAVAAFISRWSASGAAERANKDLFLSELCDLLGVERPHPVSGNPENDRYVFEKDALIAQAGGKVSTGKIDLYKEGCLLLEAKQGSERTHSKLGTARRGTPGWNIAMRDAFGQALLYAKTFDSPPPFVIVCDIGYCFDLYADFQGSWNYRNFPDAQRHRLFLADLARHVELLRTVFTEPHALDPARNAAAVTREIATHLAGLARSLEVGGHGGERIASFLMRCLFTMFAEDVGLLPAGIFTQALEEDWIPSPSRFPGEIEALWRLMDTGGTLFRAGRIRRFNGGLFSNPEALPMSKEDLERLLEAARASWVDVEPAIFGTLLERALDPRERHALGAHFTPRPYVERLVRQVVEEPLRAEWDVVRAEVRQLIESGTKSGSEQALASVHAFHKRLAETRILDPACGTGNFLYVTLDLMKRLESEVLGLLADLGETRQLLELEGLTVTPAQFHGIEIKPWAKEIADLVLWIGYLQWQLRTRGSGGSIGEPVLREYESIECRDAVLVNSGMEKVLSESGETVTRWDGESMKVSPVTGEPVPDESARVDVVRYLEPRRAEWPAADFVVGNPPYIGNWMMRRTLGDGYAEALRKAHPDVPETADLVMYWWNHAATLARRGEIRRFGFITTNTISQAFQRKVLERHLTAKDPLSIVFAVPDHPWVDSVDGAAVRVAMTVAEAGERAGTLGTVAAVASSPVVPPPSGSAPTASSMAENGERASTDGSANVTLILKRGRIHPDLRIGANVAGAEPLRANESLACPGVKLHGSGFIVTEEEAKRLGLGRVEGLDRHIRPYRNGKDMTDRPRGVLVIDLFGLDIAEVERRFPEVFQWVLERVKPERDAKSGGTKDSNEYAAKWWLFGKPRSELRKALAGLPRYIATVETAKHRTFLFLDAAILPDNKLVCVALTDAYSLGVMSSKVHVVWALAAGGRLGYGNDPVYIKTRCFDPFPFPGRSPNPAAPEPSTGDPHLVGGPHLEARIRQLGEDLDAHRKRQQALHPTLTITGMYNVLSKLCHGEELSEKERGINEMGLVSRLKKIHDDLDAAVFEAYGWPISLT